MQTKLYGKDLAGLRIPDDEPVVLIRASDEFAPNLLQDYAARCADTGRPGLASEARAQAALIRAWQATHQTDAKSKEGRPAGSRHGV